MELLTEVRGPNHAYEMHADGSRVEYAASDREARMRALGCPETIIRSLKTKWAQRKHVRRQTPIASLAEVQGTSEAALLAASRSAQLSVARRQAETMAAQTDADLRARLARATAITNADAAKERAHDELRHRMECAAGRVHSRSEADKDLYPYEQAGSGVPDNYPYADLAAAVSAQLPGHKLVGANGSQAFTKTTNGMKWTVPYSSMDGKFTFGQCCLGGHPEWVS